MFRTACGAASDCEPPLSLMVLTSDLKDAYKSGKFISSKVKRSGGSVEGFKEAAEEEERGGPDTELGKDRVAAEKEGAAGEDMLDRGGAEAAGREQVGPDGWRGGKEWME